MTEFSKHKQNCDSWYSPPFYTSVGGYKIQLRVDANGNGPDKGMQVSVFVQLMPGEHDNRLKWPLRGKFTVQLVNHRRHYGDYNWEKKIHFYGTTPKDSSG